MMVTVGIILAAVLAVLAGGAWYDLRQRRRNRTVQVDGAEVVKRSRKPQGDASGWTGFGA